MQKHCLVLAGFFLALIPSALGQTPNREICITVDDLPGTSANSMTGKELIELNSKIVAVLHDQKVPAVGFERCDRRIGDERSTTPIACEMEVCKRIGSNHFDIGCMCSISHCENVICIALLRR